MKQGVTMCCLLLVLACVSVDATAQQGASPVDKVISMMNDMLVKAKREKQDEKVRFAAFSQFCKDTTVEKKASIDKGNSDIEQAEADVAEADAEAKALAKEIAGHEADIGAWTKTKEEALELRKEEKRAFDREHAEIVANEEATAEAEKTLVEGNEDQSQAALLQISSSPRVNDKARKIVMSFLQSDPSTALMQDAMMGTPEAAAFEGKSGAVIEVVHDLGEKEHDHRKEIEEAEANRLNAHNLQVNSLEGDIKKANMQIAQKASAKAQREEDRGAANGDLSDATSARNDDKKYLEDLTAECTLKTTDFQKRQVMRQGEIEAIQKAMEIMSSPDVAGGSQHAALVQSKRSSFAQLRSSAERHNAQRIAANFLATRGKKLNSEVLSLLAVRTSEDPFAKVTSMIKNMIKKLMEQANEEAEHKAFCDTETATNKMTRDTKTALVAELQASIEELSADINELALKISQTSAAIAEIDAALTKATTERNDEKAKNTQTIEDGKIAQAATQRAMQVLKEYYDKAANQVDLPEAEGPIKYDPRSLQILSKSAGGALVQEKQRVPGAPEMESGKYTGMENGGILGMLEIIESDFSDLIAETTASEAESARVFEQFTNDSNQNTAVKNTELKHRQNKQVQKQSDLQQTKNDLKAAQKELQAASDYWAKLKPDCVEEAMSYADKKAAREEEIESLQDALGILSQGDIA
jgi:nucleoprotein TPR